MCIVCESQKLSYGAGAAEMPAYGGNGSNFLGSQPATSDQNINGLLEGDKWGSLNLRYSFPTLATQYEASLSEPTLDFATATAGVKAATRFALNLLAQYTNMVVSEVNPATTTADIRVAFSSEANPTAYAYFPSDGPAGGDMWLGTDTPSYQNPIKGQYAWHTILHELGHALGLKHGHETGGVAGVAMQAAFDQMSYSVMTYRSFQGGPLTGYSNELNGYAQTFMMYDIAALQKMYGANFNTNAGNTTYSWSATTGEMSINGVGQGAPGGNRIFMTVWDGNGVDTYNFSNYTSALNINLAPGNFSVTSAVQIANLGDSNMAPGNIFNALLFNGDLRSLIENVVGGSGADTIVGNVANNRIQGGGGADTLNGGGGNDTFVLDVDNVVDTIIGGSGTADIVDLFNATSGVSVTFSSVGAGSLSGGGLGADSFTSVERIYGSNFDDVINGRSGNEFLHGRAGDDTFRDGAGEDSIHGGDDDDRVFLSADNRSDSFFGGNGTTDIVDLINATSGVSVTFSGIGAGSLSGGGLGTDSFTDVERIYGSNFGDVITGSAGSDFLHGRAGNDTLRDGAGADSLHGGDDNDRIIFSADNSADSFLGGNGTADIVDLFNATSGVSVTFSGIGAGSLSGGGLGADSFTDVERIYGSNFGDVITGSAGSDFLHGRAGSDTIRGGRGSDTLFGGDENDTFSFSSIDFQAGVGDRIGDFHLLGGDTDTLRLQGSSGQYSFANSGANVVVTHISTGGTITIDAMTTAQLSGHILFF